MRRKLLRAFFGCAAVYVLLWIGSFLGTSRVKACCRELTEADRISAIPVAPFVFHVEWSTSKPNRSVLFGPIWPESGDEYFLWALGWTGALTNPGVRPFIY